MTPNTIFMKHNGDNSNDKRIIFDRIYELNSLVNINKI